MWRKIKLGKGNRRLETDVGYAFYTDGWGKPHHDDDIFGQKRCAVINHKFSTGQVSVGSHTPGIWLL